MVGSPPAIPVFRPSSEPPVCLPAGLASLVVRTVGTESGFPIFRSITVLPECSPAGLASLVVQTVGTDPAVSGAGFPVGASAAGLASLLVAPAVLTLTSATSRQPAGLASLVFETYTVVIVASAIACISSSGAVSQERAETALLSDDPVSRSGAAGLRSAPGLGALPLVRESEKLWLTPELLDGSDIPYG